MEIPPVSIALEELGIPHKIFRHDAARPVTSFEQAASERGQRESQIVRSILFRITADEFVMVLIAGSAQISWKIMRKYLGLSRITMATEDEVLAVTGYRIGTVSPFGLPHQLKVLIDASVTPALACGASVDEEEISIGSGMRNTAIILKSSDLHHALSDVEVVSLTER